MTVEKVFVREDGSAERRVWKGDGKPAEITEFDTDEMLLAAVGGEQSHLSRLQRAKKSLSAIGERVLVLFDNSSEARANQLAAEMGSPALLREAEREWSRSEEADYA